MNVHSMSSSGFQRSDHWQRIPSLKVARVHTGLLKIYSVIIPYIIWGQICAFLLCLHINQTKFQIWDNRRQLIRKPKSSSCLTQRAGLVTHCKESSGEKLHCIVPQNSLSGLFFCLFSCLFFCNRSEKGAFSFVLWVGAACGWHPKSETCFPQLQSWHILHILHSVLHIESKQWVGSFFS